jgi:hypothetical protein
VEAPGKDGKASMPEQVKRPIPWSRRRRMMMMNYALIIKHQMYVVTILIVHIKKITKIHTSQTKYHFVVYKM